MVMVLLLAHFEYEYPVLYICMQIANYSILDLYSCICHHHHHHHHHISVMELAHLLTRSYIKLWLKVFLFLDGVQ
jgi:hypothetical protein